MFSCQTDNDLLLRCEVGGCTRFARRGTLCLVHFRKPQANEPGGRMNNIRVKNPVIYVIGFSGGITKVGRSERFSSRRKELSANGAHKIENEAVFLIDPEEDLQSVEAMVLGDVAGLYPIAAGLEYFRASFHDVFQVVASSLASAGIVASLQDDDRGNDEQRIELSEITSDQVDAAIKRLCIDHGISSSRIIKFIGADVDAIEMKRSGFATKRVAEKLIEVHQRPRILFDRR